MLETRHVKIFLHPPNCGFRLEEQGRDQTGLVAKNSDNTWFMVLDTLVQCPPPTIPHYCMIKSSVQDSRASDYRLMIRGSQHAGSMPAFYNFLLLYDKSDWISILKPLAIKARSMDTWRYELQYDTLNVNDFFTSSTCSVAIIA
uniref:Uncharacterized protein n=1 Tax=Romanomermis culicivorax TaxID=13658 RepID=A0A915I0B7_ROMCU